VIAATGSALYFARAYRRREWPFGMSES
jgi:hypothetical protein